MPSKTNAMRILDELGIRYDVREYEVDLADLSAEAVANKIGLPVEQVFKTLLIKGDHIGFSLAVVPGNAALDLKSAAQLSGDRKVEMVPLKDVQAVTGYLRGAVTSLACKKAYPVLLEELATVYDVISVSAGLRGLQILIHPDAYARAVGAKLGSIAKDK
jgi:Cys-tRNA(Pro)/Cys-tRNA(Cys) deacylase